MNRRGFLKSLFAAGAIAAASSWMPSALSTATGEMPKLVGRKTLVDYARELDPDYSVIRIADMLAANNEILGDLVWEEHLPIVNVDGHDCLVYRRA